MTAAALGRERAGLSAEPVATEGNLLALWLNEIIQPPPDPEANRWIEVIGWQVAACDGNVCAAAILAYFFARHFGKLKHAAEGREDNRIAVAHEMKPRRAAESLWFRATDEQIEKAIFFFKRRSFPDAIRFLEEKGFVSKLAKNPNPAFPFDKSRYFKLNPEAVQARLRELFDYDAEDVNPLDSTPRKIADSKRKNARSTGKNAPSSRKIADNLTNNKGTKGEEDSSESSSSGVDSKDESTPVVGRDEKLRLKGILEGVEPLPEGVEPDEALLAWLPVALESSRAVQGLFAFIFWKFHHRHPKAIFDAKRKRAADDRLKAGYTLDRLLLAIRGIKFSAHHMALNPKTNPDNKIFDDFGLILRDAKQVETFEALALQSDEADRRRAAEGALRSDLPAVPESRFSDAELEDFARTVADMLSQGYEVSHLKAKFNVGKTVAVPEWTRILERAAAIKAERDSRSMNGNGKAEAVRGSESAEWTEASDAARDSPSGPRAMPEPRKEDFE